MQSMLRLMHKSWRATSQVSPAISAGYGSNMGPRGLQMIAMFNSFEPSYYWMRHTGSKTERPLRVHCYLREMHFMCTPSSQHGHVVRVHHPYSVQVIQKRTAAKFAKHLRTPRLLRLSKAGTWTKTSWTATFINRHIGSISLSRPGFRYTLSVNRQPPTPACRAAGCPTG